MDIFVVFVRIFFSIFFKTPQVENIWIKKIWHRRNSLSIIFVEGDIVIKFSIACLLSYAEANIPVEQ